MNIALKRLLGILIIVTLALFSTWFFSDLYTPPAKSIVLDGCWMKLCGQFKSISLGSSFYITAEDKPDFKEGIKKVFYQLDYRSDEDIRIVFPYMSGNGVRLYLNGKAVGDQGELTRGDGVRWSVPFQVIIDKDNLEEQNTLELDFYDLYEYGILQVPYIISVDHSPLKTSALFFFTAQLPTLVIGSFLALAFMLFLPALRFMKEDHTALSLTATLIFAAIFILDYGHFDFLPFPYILFKRISISSMHFCLAFLLICIASLLYPQEQRRWRIWFQDKTLRVYSFFFLLEITFSILPLLIGENMVELRALYRIINLSVLPSMFLLALSIISVSRETRYFRPLLVGVGFTLTVAIRDIYISLSGSVAPFFTQLGLVVFLFTAVIEVVTHIMDNFTNWEGERSRADLLQKQSLIDPLTGALNRKMMKQLHDNHPDHYSLLVFDLDNFKMINDKFGHPFGDQILIDLVRILYHQVREGDSVIRMGGDEFLVFLPGCSLDSARLLAARILIAIRTSKVEFDGKTTYYSSTIGVGGSEDGGSLGDILKLSDKRLYDAKFEKGSFR